MSEKGIHMICIHLFLLIYIMYYNFNTFFLPYFFFHPLYICNKESDSIFLCLLATFKPYLCVSCFISHLGKPRHSSFATSVKFKPYAGMLMLSTTVKTPSQSPFLVLSSHFQNSKSVSFSSSLKSFSKLRGVTLLSPENLIK